MAPPKGRNVKPTHQVSSKCRTIGHGDAVVTPDVAKSKLDLQQRCLNIFRSTFDDAYQSPETLNSNIQKVKMHLFDRDFVAAFGTIEHLQAYCVRWSPSRALCYLRELQNLDSLANNLRVVCFGGGSGAELVSLAATISQMQHITEANFVDMAEWSAILKGLYSSITTAPPLSEYASAQAKLSNKAMVPDSRLSYSFLQQNVLELDAGHLKSLLEDVHLVTIFFTLNELYSTSISQANAFINGLWQYMQPGSQLLVIDSAGSYATVNLNGSEKNYPMQWLLDYTFLGKKKNHSNNSSSISWTKLRSDDSVWFRLPDGLKYPFQLEDMRYQIHIFQRNFNENE